MKLIDITHNPTPDNPIQGTIKQLRQKLPFLGKTTDQIQQNILGHFQRGLDNRFTMVQNFMPESFLRPIPFILVGPNGVTVFNLRMEKGVYRVKEDTWHEMNPSTQRFGMARLNLVKQTQTITQAIGDFLAHKGHPDVPSVPVLLFADPGVHVDQNRPAIRIVLADGIDYLVASFLKAPETIDQAQINAICDIFDQIARSSHPDAGADQDFFGHDLGLDIEKPKPKEPRPVPQFKLDLPPFMARLKFTRAQWLLLAAIVVVNIFVLMWAILIVVFMTN